MNQLRLEESVRTTLAKCAERGDSSITREHIHTLLNDNAQESIDVLSILVRELWVFVLHQETNLTPSVQSTPLKSADESKLSTEGSNKKPSEPKTSLLGMISLPRPMDLPDDKFRDEISSASDVPSHSSTSSEDEDNEDQLAGEMWKETLALHDSEHDQTHKDFFEALVHDVEGECQGINPTEKQQSVDGSSPAVDDLALEDRIYLAVTSSIALAEQTQLERLIADGDEDDEVVLTSNMISDISMNIAVQMELDGLQAMRCAEDIEDCLCFLYGQVLSSENRAFMVQTIQKLMLDRSQYLEAGQWFSPQEEADDDNETFNTEQLQLGDTLSSTPEKSALTASRASAYVADEAVADVASRATAALTQQTPARTTPHRHVTPGLSTAGKRARINYNEIAPDTPAWMIPKSPLDSLFRTGFGGIGQSQLNDVIALVEDEDDSSNGEEGNEFGPEDSEHDEHQQRLAASYEQRSDSDSDAIDIDDIPNDFGRELLAAQTTTSRHQVVIRSPLVKKHPYGEVVEELDVAVPHPSDHPVHGHDAHHSHHNITKNQSLNDMIHESYKALIKQYAGNRGHAHVHYDYDETTVGTSLDSEGYKRALLNAKIGAALVRKPSASPVPSPKRKSPANSPKGKKPVVAAVVKSKKTAAASLGAGPSSKILLDDQLSEDGEDAPLALESPNESFTVPKRSKCQSKKAKSMKKTNKKKSEADAAEKAVVSMFKSAAVTSKGSKKSPSCSAEVTRRSITKKDTLLSKPAALAVASSRWK